MVRLCFVVTFVLGISADGLRVDCVTQSGVCNVMRQCSLCRAA